MPELTRRFPVPEWDPEIQETVVRGMEGRRVVLTSVAGLTEGHEGAIRTPVPNPTNRSSLAGGAVHPGMQNLSLELLRPLDHLDRIPEFRMSGSVPWRGGVQFREIETWDISEGKDPREGLEGMILCEHVSTIHSEQDMGFVVMDVFVIDFQMTDDLVPGLEDVLRTSFHTHLTPDRSWEFHICVVFTEMLQHVLMGQTRWGKRNSPNDPDRHELLKNTHRKRDLLGDDEKMRV